MESLHDICRVCANKIKDKKRQQHIFKYMRGKLLNKLKLITGVELSPDEGLPKFICDRCNMELDLAIKFRERCIFSQKYLADMHAKIQNKIDMEAAEHELHEDLIDEEQLEYIDEDELHLEDNENDNGNEILADAPNDKAVVNENNNHDKYANGEERHWVLLEDSRPAKRMRNFFICEECGYYFKDEYEYNEHIDSHIENKEWKRLFPCLKCSNTFNSRESLKIHRQQMHSGDRFFKCTTCGKTFLEHSAKQRHEKAHINERPYPCLECGSVFNSVSELRLHFTIHTTRKFRCEACNMDFLTRDDLVAHTHTYRHQHTLQQMQAEISMLYGDTEILNSDSDDIKL